MLEKKRPVSTTYKRKKARLSEASSAGAHSPPAGESDHSTSSEDQLVSQALSPRRDSLNGKPKLPSKSEKAQKAREAAAKASDVTEWDESLANVAPATDTRPTRAAQPTKPRQTRPEKRVTPSNLAKTRSEPVLPVAESSKAAAKCALTAQAAKTGRSRQHTPEHAPQTTQQSPRPPSPAKDLSNVFARYLKQPAQPTSDSDAESNSGEQQQHKRGSGTVVSALAARKTLKSPSNSSLQRSHSLPGSVSPTKSLGTSASLEQVLSSPSRAESESLVSLIPPSPSRQRSALSGARPSNGLKRTYGGARTIKADESQKDIFRPVAGPSNSREDGNDDSNGLARPVKIAREAYSALRERWGADEEEAMADGELKSAVQMKARGETARLTDESAYLLEGLEPSHPIGLKRTSAIEVVKKLSKDDFRRRVKASGIFEDVYTVFRRAGAGESDKVLDACLALLLCMLCADQRVAEPLMRISPSQFQDPDDTVTTDEMYESTQCDVLAVLRTMSSSSTADQPLDAVRVPKNELRLLRDLIRVIDDIALLSTVKLPTTLKSLCLLSVSAISSFAPRAIFRPQQLICSSGMLDHVAQSLVSTVEALSERVGRFETGLDLIPSDGTTNLKLVDMHLRIIETCLGMENSAYASLRERIEILSKAFHDILLVCEVVLLQEPSNQTDESSAMDCVVSTLQILIDLTTTSPLWSACLAEASLTPLLVRIITLAKRLDRFKNDADEDNKSHSFDCLCLALGVLTNMAESVDRIRTDVREFKLARECPVGRRCARECKCDERTSLLDRLVDLYLHDLDKWGNELNTSFVSGYSAILLGLLMLDSEENMTKVTDALGETPDKLKSLLEAMTEFADLHSKNDEEVPNGTASLAERIERLVVQVRSR